ncbi:UNVERIFIED_CONTAM: hypothetical protein NCL1_46924 [Trichonephila clavipes]
MYGPKREPFGSQLVTGDEMWIVYEPVVLKKKLIFIDKWETSPSTSKADVHHKKEKTTDLSLYTQYIRAFGVDSSVQKRA